MDYVVFITSLIYWFDQPNHVRSLQELNKNDISSSSFITTLESPTLRTCQIFCSCFSSSLFQVRSIDKSLGLVFVPGSWCGSRLHRLGFVGLGMRIIRDHREPLKYLGSIRTQSDRFR